MQPAVLAVPARGERSTSAGDAEVVDDQQVAPGQQNRLGDFCQGADSTSRVAVSSGVLALRND